MLALRPNLSCAKATSSARARAGTVRRRKKARSGDLAQIDVLAKDSRAIDVDPRVRCSLEGRIPVRRAGARELGLWLDARTRHDRYRCVHRARERDRERPPRRLPSPGHSSGVEAMKRYLLSIQQPDGEPPPPEILNKIMRDLHAVQQEIQRAGGLIFNAGLHPPSTATVVRPQDGKILTTDGPYAEGKEHVGGLVIVKAPDLDTALDWGRKLAKATTLPIEVRPFQGEAEHP
jgi:hypothetical protein